VEARREDSTRDPFKLIEESGYFYGRGVSDMKSLVADWGGTMMRPNKRSRQSFSVDAVGTIIADRRRVAPGSCTPRRSQNRA
jgi:hypothetical protein